mmetsp:Transcript_6847/g.27999  ORF Transcript_6847/g.27999 Transcript_6847/m.27999 type:complete len:257 (-) Transcript_6847:214-984(-)
MIPRAMVCAASHRLNGSESCAKKKTLSFVSNAGTTVIVTGAEKFRRSEGRGSPFANGSTEPPSGAPTVLNANVAFMALSTRTTLVDGSSESDPFDDSLNATRLPRPTFPLSEPSTTAISTRPPLSGARISISDPVAASSRPTVTGMSCATFASDPCSSGVLGNTCSKVRKKVFAAASNRRSHRTEGVPAWWYQLCNASMSTSWLASRIDAKKSSHVTAQPSCLSKYRSIPFRNPVSPSKVWYTRITSAPFSYTVRV